MFGPNESALPRILLAEDDPDQSDMLREALTMEGYTVDTAFSGDKACKKLHQHKYDLIILDVRMPGMDGGAVLRDFRSKQADSSRTQVMIVSAFATGLDLLRFRSDGADACFSKPYSLAHLLSECRRLIDLRRAHHVS